jgi:predicted Zn finger-like uncharacterized protein
MQIACTQCQTRYDVPDEKLERGAVKVQCSRCSHLFVVRKRRRVAEPTEPEPRSETRFEDLDFTQFQEAAGAGPSPSPSEEAPQPSTSSARSDDGAIPPLGELDLGDFEGLDEDFGLDAEATAAEGTADREDEEEPLQPVRAEELVSIRSREPQIQDSAEDMPRLNIQRGPRRAEGAAPSPLVARDRRRSPFLWIVLLAALCTAGFTGYNVYRYPDAAFSFLHPSQIRKLWQRRAIEAEFGKEELKGYYKDLPAGRRMFVIRGTVVNRSSSAQSLIRVEGLLYARDGKTVASRTVFCGNVLSDRDLTNLPFQTVEARLQNQMGEAFNNVDIAPGARVPFMVVFPSPPEGIEKFSVTVTEAKVGSKS